MNTRDQQQMTELHLPGTIRETCEMVGIEVKKYPCGKGKTMNRAAAPRYFLPRLHHVMVPSGYSRAQL